jgi:hypothetical protein
MKERMFLNEEDLGKIRMLIRGEGGTPFNNRKIDSIRWI